MKLNSTSRILILMFILILPNPIYSYSNCASNSTAIGCIACDTPITHSYSFNLSESKYTCIDTLNCISVSANNCTACAPPYSLDSFNNSCISFQGCILVYNNTCQSCEPTNFVLLEGACYQKQIDYCVEYTLSNSTIGCLKCAYIEMNPSLNCTYNSSICLSFNYQTMKCTSCPTGTIIHSDGKSCYSPVSNCEVYSTSSAPQCLLCQQYYIYDPTSRNCILGQPKGIKFQIISYNLQTATPLYSYLCLNNLFMINQTQLNCSTSAALHCAQFNSTSSNCIECIPGYFLRTADLICRQCSISISNCALCSNQTVCTSCSNGFFLLVSGANSVCMPCSTFGCSDCSTDFDVDGKVRCLSCPANKTLYAGSCISCQNSLSAFSVTDSICQKCAIANCIFCQFTTSSPSEVCLECSYTFFYNPTTKICQQIQQSTVVSFETAFQILKKVAPGSDNVLYPDGKALVSFCNQTDGFVCLCSSLNLTSFCKTISTVPNISSLNFTYQKIASYPNQLRMAAQLPTFTLQTNLLINTYEPLSLSQFWNLLSALSLVILRSQSISSSTVLKIFNHGKSMINVFSDQQITILRGNGFYFKFIPQGLQSGSLGDDNYIKTNLAASHFVMIYIFYPRLNSLSDGSLTGTIYILTNNPNSVEVTVRKTRYSVASSTYVVKVQGTPNSSYNISLSSGQLLIKQFPKSSTTQSKGVQIFGVAAADSTSDIYFSQRIENIFFSESLLYILFFIVLYLIFIPLCAMVDCCETQQTARKRVGSEEPNENKDEGEETIVKVNYRDFFPIYNVGNTSRPSRLSKLCLFIVNMQHIVTFLTIIYVNLPGQLPVAAIALLIPAYLCTVIMGYICGAIFRFLPGRLKLLINIISLGYWILWIFVMKAMNDKPSKQYKLFILVFSILSFFLDLTIDALQTLLVYFAINQGEKQISLFRCLAKWLSFRGFYEFDKLAKQMQASEQ